MAYTDEWRRVHGVWLHWQDWPDRGPVATTDRAPVLCLHGLTQQSHTFDAVAAHVRRRVIALDLRGRGESGWAPGTYTLGQYVADVQGLLDALGVGRVHVLGTSLGGLVGLSLAAAQPSRVASLALNDIGPEIDPRGAARVAAYAATVPGRFPSLDAVTAWARGQYPWLADVSPDVLAASVGWAARRDPDGGWRLKFDPAIGQGPPPAAAAMAAATRAWWTALEVFAGPVLLVRGAESDILAAETAGAMAARQPRLRRLDVPGVGHAPTLAEGAVLAALERLYARDEEAACASS